MKKNSFSEVSGLFAALRMSSGSTYFSLPSLAVLSFGVNLATACRAVRQYFRRQVSIMPWWFSKNISPERCSALYLSPPP